MAYVLTVKWPGQKATHYAVEGKSQALHGATQLARTLPKGGTISILERQKGGGLRIIGGVMKAENPRRRRRRPR